MDEEGYKRDAEARVKRYAERLTAPHRDPAGNFVLAAIDPGHSKDIQEKARVYWSEEAKRIYIEKLAAEAEKATNDLLAATADPEEQLEGAATAPLPEPPTPPQAGEWLVGLFCKRDMREAALGDLDEKFALLAERRGPRVAKAWYWGQAGRSVLFFAVRWGRRVLELEAILKRIL